MRVRYGAVAYLAGFVQFIAGIAVAATRYGPGPYSPLRDTISDLQAVHCGAFNGSVVCSPLNAVANLSVAILGVTTVLGSVLIRGAVPDSSRRDAAIGLMVVAGAATFANAFTPEDVTYLGDIVTALVAFLCANFGLVQLGRAFSASQVGRRVGVFTELMGTVGLAAVIVSGIGIVGPAYAGGVEWLIVSPFLIWSFVVGVRALRPRD